MIAADNLIEIGRFGKPHGIKGELSAIIPDFDIDPETLPCIFVELDGLMVPFFIIAVRTKGSESFLLTLEGITSQEKASEFTNKSIYARPEDIPADDTEDYEGFYLDDLIGFTIQSDGCKIGTITDFDDSTDNYLFHVEDSGSTILVPANPELIESVDTDTKTIYMNLPTGLTDL